MITSMGIVFIIGGQIINLIKSQAFESYKEQISNKYYEAFDTTPIIRKITFVKGAEIIF